MAGWRAVSACAVSMRVSVARCFASVFMVSCPAVVRCRSPAAPVRRGGGILERCRKAGRGRAIDRPRRLTRRLRGSLRMPRSRRCPRQTRDASATGAVRISGGSIPSRQEAARRLLPSAASSCWRCDPPPHR